MRTSWIIVLVLVCVSVGVAGQVAAFDTTVYLAQEALAGAGHDPGAVDGLWGQATSRAVSDFQESVGLSPMGSLNDATLDSLDVGRLQTFVLFKGETFGDIYTESDVTVESVGGLLLKYSGAIESVMTGGGFVQLIWNDGATHHLKGPVQIQGPGFQDYLFEGDPEDPLTFKMINHVGYVYLGGSGVVTHKPSGDTFEFGVGYQRPN